MILINNSFSPLPFYESKDDWNCRKDYAYGKIYPLVIKSNMLLPFQIIIDASYDTILSAFLYDYNKPDMPGIDILNTMVSYGLTIQTDVGYNILLYPGRFSIPELTQEGRYYLEITLSNSESSAILYSEIFTSCNRLNDYICINYRNTFPFAIPDGEIIFPSTFDFQCWLNTQIGKPEYQYEEEADERLGYSFIESQVSKKVYKFTFFAPEFLCDALRLIRLCDIKTIEANGKTYKLSSFEMNVEWEEQGDLAAVECSFETDTVVANIGYYAKELSGHDFNNDYNYDYDAETVSFEDLPTCYIYYDKDSFLLQAQYEPASDITVTSHWRRTDDPNTYTSVDTIPAGSTAPIDIRYGDEIFVDISLSPLSDSTYKYELQEKDL